MHRIWIDGTDFQAVAARCQLKAHELFAEEEKKSGEDDGREQAAGDFDARTLVVRRRRLGDGLPPPTPIALSDRRHFRPITDRSTLLARFNKRCPQPPDDRRSPIGMAPGSRIDVQKVPLFGVG